MSYEIRRIDLYVRETPPGRLTFALGKQRGLAKPLTSPLAHVRLVLRDSSGNETFGTSADRLSVRWLDKRPGRSKGLKLRELVELVYRARTVYLDEPSFESAFEKWLESHAKIMALGRAAGQEDLTSSFASALLERAVIDAVCRLAGKSFFDMVRGEGLGIRPERLHAELAGMRIVDYLPRRPRARLFLRHTVGLADPLAAKDLPRESRVNDGLPETLKEYIERDGIHYFKVKISGDADADLKRLERVWDVIVDSSLPVVTLDANESYRDLAQFESFVRRLERDLTGLFQHIEYIEQPLPRGLTLDASTATAIRRIAAIKPLIIDEADGTLDAFKEAHAIGYHGASHKNCKGVFKSLLNHCLVAYYQAKKQPGFLSAEDLQNLPIVPLHQDFATVAALGLTHCERNGHHYNFGLSFVSAKDKESVARHHRDLYVRREDEWFLGVRRGAVECASLQCPGFGVRDEPDFASMEDLRAWVRRRYPV